MPLSVMTKETRDWFETCVGVPTRAQAEGWRAIASGSDALICAPTGSGKTLAAFLYFIDQLGIRAREGTLADEVQVIYLSPLKALGNDIRENLKRPLEGLRLTPLVRAEVRTGDTEPEKRRQMLKKPPHILITTPESLYLLLTSVSGKKLIATARVVIVDEMHAIISSKRGTHLMLSLARLDALAKRRIQRVALSATIRPLEEAARQLSGDMPCAIIAPPSDKKRAISVITPLDDMRMLSGGTIWPFVADRVLGELNSARATLAFVDGRAGCERLAYQLNHIAGEAIARTHHGCVSKEQRLEAEQRFKSGELRIMVATSSMELGIDVGEIDIVTQVGNPMSVSAALQRLGRAGHNPGRESRMHIYPRTAAEAVSCGLTAKAAMEGQIEEIQAPEMCLDLLSQHLVSMAATEEYSVDDAVAILGKATAYRALTRETVEAVLRMLAGDYEHQNDAPAHPRVIYDRINGLVRGDGYTRMLALSAGGTIPERGWFAVTLPDGTRLGELDEEFVFEARIGDKFLLGSFPWRIADITHDRVIVTSTSQEGAVSPFWKGDRAMRAYATGRYFGALMADLERAAHADTLTDALQKLYLTPKSAENAARVMKSQLAATGCLPTDKLIIMEHFSDEAGEHQLMVHSVFGSRVNRALSMLLTRKAASVTGLDARAFDDDDGVLIYLLGGAEIPDGLLQTLNPATAADTVRALLPATPMFSMAFRYNCARALIMGARGGRRLPLWVQRLRGAETLSLAIRDDTHPIIRETINECADTMLDLPALTALLTDIAAGRVSVREIHANTPSPMSLPLRREVENALLYESLIPTAAVQYANTKAEMTIKPDKAILTDAARPGGAPRDEDALHARMMAEGDFLAEELDAPLEWLEALTRAGRARYIEPGLWIAQEHRTEYESALSEGSTDALTRITRRALRYRGAQDEGTISERYAISVDTARSILGALAERKDAVLTDGAYVHAEVYARAQRQTLSARRRAVKTVPPENYAAALLATLRAPGTPGEQLARALTRLSGIPLPLEMWEQVVLPARVTAYRPRLLDDALASGAFFYRVTPGEKPLLSFHRPDEVDWDAPVDTDADTEEARAILSALAKRGALFAHSFTPLLNGKGAAEPLKALTASGRVRADQFAPIRDLIESEQGLNAKKAARRRVRTQDAGRWEIARPLKVPDADDTIRGLFAAYLIACRETARGNEWQVLLSRLRVMEFTGEARRGYFVNGLSGAQFLSKEDDARARLLLADAGASPVCVCAADPMQPWGGILAHMPGRSFTRLSSTAVVLIGGRPAAVFERRGETLRAFEPEALTTAVACFTEAFLCGAIFPDMTRILVREYPKDAETGLREAGFHAEMLDFILYKNGL